MPLETVSPVLKSAPLSPPLCHERLRRELAQEELVFRPDGTIPLPTKPGLGVEVDWDVVKRYKAS